MTVLQDEYAAVKQRVLDILGGYAFDGALGAAAQAHAIRPATFRYSPAPMDDPALPVAAFGRGFDFQWLGIQDGEDGTPTNDLDDFVPETVRFQLRIGYLAGPALASDVHLLPNSTEVAATVVLDPQGRAARDARAIRRALGWYELFAGTTPTISDITRAGEVTTQDLRGGRVLAVSTWRALLWVDNSQSNSP